MLRDMQSHIAVSPDDDGADLIVKRLPRKVDPTDSDTSPKKRNPPPTTADHLEADTSGNLPARRSGCSGKPKKLPAPRATRSLLMKHKLLDLQAREDKDGHSVSGSGNSSDDAYASDLSYVSASGDHPTAERHQYLASLQSQNDFPTPMHKYRHSDKLFDGRELLADVLLEREEAKRLARVKAKTDDPTAYAARKVAVAAAKSEREAARQARRLAQELNAGKEAPSPAKIASRHASRPASRPVQQLPQAPKQDLVLLGYDLPSPNREICLISSDSGPPIATRTDDPIPSRLPSPAARAVNVQQPKFHAIFKPFRQAAASTFTLSHEDQFHALVNCDDSLKSPQKLVANLRPPSPSIVVAGRKNAALELSLLITPLVLFPTAVGVCLNSPRLSPSHLSQHLLSPVARPPSLPLVRSHQSPPVHQTLSATLSEMSLATKRPDMRPSPTSHVCDPLIPADNKFRNRLKLRRKQPLFCNGSELHAIVANAAAETSPQGTLEKASIAALLNVGVQTSPRSAIEPPLNVAVCQVQTSSIAALLNVAVQTSPRSAIEPPLNVAVQTSPRCALEPSLDEAIQTSPRIDPEKPVTAREMRSAIHDAIHELLVGLGFGL